MSALEGGEDGDVPDFGAQVFWRGVDVGDEACERSPADPGIRFDGASLVDDSEGDDARILFEAVFVECVEEV